MFLVVYLCNTLTGCVCECERVIVYVCVCIFAIGTVIVNMCVCVDQALLLIKISSDKKNVMA